MRVQSLGALATVIAMAACSSATATPTPTPPPASPTAAAGGGDAAAPQGRAGRGRAGGRGGAQQQQAEPRPYSEVIPEDAETRTGMFTVHKTDDQLLFEIPQNMLGQDQLLVIEIAETALGIGYGGQSISNRVYRWEKRGDQLLLRGVSYSAIADPNTPEYEAMKAANVDPIVAAFPIEAYGPNNTMVIDVSNTFLQPPPELSLNGRVPGNIDTDRSWVDRAVPFPDNVNVYSTLTFSSGGRGGAAADAGGGRGGRGGGNSNPSNTVVVSWSFHHLPEQPMMPRLCDERVGYFSATTTDYTDDDQQVGQRCYITRYRLEKQNPNAEISDPVKPIVYYIDPATPTKWIPYFKAAIESWQPAFEAAGFSNAIIAKEAPDDPDWSPEDARYSVVRWLPSTTENASGPHIHDPRSGEILNAHIQFYQNVQRLQLTWYFTQAAAVDPRARKFPFPDDLMGELLQYVLAHEVGHTLGFQHNMKASSMYPADSLRSESFLRRMGHTPTLMDYSRFNYMVQPEDNIPVELLIPRIGPYDTWATMWGYKPIPSAKTPEAERPILDEWAREQDQKPYLRFTTAGSSGADPGEESEAVGDGNPVLATGLGIKNIKREVDYLIPATVKPTEGYDDLDNLYGRLVGQWRTELGHVANVIGGTDSQNKYGSQKGVRFMPINKARQKEAVAFLNSHAFQTPTFFLVDDITRRLEPSGSLARIVGAQSSILNSALQDARLHRLAEWSHGAAPGSAYTINELMRDLRGGVFSELRSGQDIDVYRRALQRAYIENLSGKINPAPAEPAAAGGGGRGGGRGGAGSLSTELSDIYPAVRLELQELDAEIERAVSSKSGLQRAHLEDLRYRIKEALSGGESQ